MDHKNPEIPTKKELLTKIKIKKRHLFCIDFINCAGVNN